jgi:hypothetical protein
MCEQCGLSVAINVTCLLCETYTELQQHTSQNCIERCNVCFQNDVEFMQNGFARVHTCR